VIEIKRKNPELSKISVNFW